MEDGKPDEPPRVPRLPRVVSTQEASSALRVSVSTIKRWVDAGKLRAERTAGGHRRIVTADLIELRDQQQLPTIDLSRLETSASEPVDVGKSSEALSQLLEQGSASEARQLILQFFSQGASLAQIGDELIQPAMANIGDRWQAGKIDVLHEHRASQICAGILIELKSNLESRYQGARPRALGAGPPDDHYSLALLLVQLVLLDAGWEAINLGPSTPLSSMARALDDVQPQLVWISAGNRINIDRFLPDYNRLAKAALARDIPIVVGGRGLTKELRQHMTYTAHGEKLSDLETFLEQLNK